jgi:hypothetical protein
MTYTGHGTKHIRCTDDLDPLLAWPARLGEVEGQDHLDVVHIAGL